jgi:hypothetical protein
MKIIINTAIFFLSCTVGVNPQNQSPKPSPQKTESGKIKIVSIEHDQTSVKGARKIGDAQEPIIYFDCAHGNSSAYRNDAAYSAIAKKHGAQAVFSLSTLNEQALAEASVAVLTFIPPVQQPLTKEELAVLRKFIKKGGSVLVIADEEQAAKVKLEKMRLNELLMPFDLKLTDDTPFIPNRGALAPASDIFSATHEIPYSGGRAVEGGLPLAFVLDESGQLTNIAHTAFVTTSAGGNIVVMAEAMASLFLGGNNGQRLVDNQWWGKDSAAFMEDILRWMLKQPDSVLTADITALANNGKGWTLHNLTAKAVNKEQQKGVQLKVQDHKAAGGIGTGGIAYFEMPLISAGTIEFTAWGEPDGGCGIVFAGKDLLIHESVYFRPYAFSNSQMNALVGEWVEGRDDAVQYVAHPEFGWQQLRNNIKTRGVYEKPVTGIQPQRWFRARVRFDKETVSVWVGNQRQPCLSVKRLHAGQDGKIGLWVGNGAPAVFGSLQITANK